ncbi:helix-turn-helix transcriptional regulator [Streptomyces sp. JJ36]|uniref:helix-turn-helix transcriptional regulator n=1 Tax=Streptomyces sp. JJ36 TaxID=2736645 RepID=UPI001F208CDB|nr:helix-turn-helix transcriptional regulator [Streptomyces sp. JJ36]MCF6522121.1 helix-turn-helix domain-containing protein [Streptomyces sp. JJ36]
MNRSELADFLRRSRARLTPADVGLPPGARRRTPGLRREEVAGLAGMSTDYYARLEQARGPRPSRQMLGALARALRLTDDGSDHLFHLAGEEPPRRQGTPDRVRPALLRVLDRLYDTPAQVYNDWGDVLAQNAMAVALVGDLASRPPRDRNMVRRFFLGAADGPGGPGSRYFVPPEDRPRHARTHVANLRAVVAARPGDPGPAALVAELRAASREFAVLWEDHEVEVQRAAVKRFRHPVVGELELECEALASHEHAQRLIVYTARPGTESHARLELLRVVGLQDGPRDVTVAGGTGGAGEEAGAGVSRRRAAGRPHGR